MVLLLAVSCLYWLHWFPVLSVFFYLDWDDIKRPHCFISSSYLFGINIIDIDEAIKYSHIIYIVYSYYKKAMCRIIISILITFNIIPTVPHMNLIVMGLISLISDPIYPLGWWCINNTTNCVYCIKNIIYIPYSIDQHKDTHIVWGHVEVQLILLLWGSHANPYNIEFSWWPTPQQYIIRLDR